MIETMFIKKLHNNRQKIITTILAVISIVFICDFLCDMGILNNAMAHQEGQISHEIVFYDKHEAPSTPLEKTFHEEAQDEDCCEEETSKLYANLVKYEIPTFDLDKVIVLLELPWSSSFSALQPFKETNPYTLNSALSPPVRGLYARVLFQSFLC